MFTVLTVYKLVEVSVPKPLREKRQQPEGWVIKRLDLFRASAVPMLVHAHACK